MRTHLLHRLYGIGGRRTRRLILSLVLKMEGGEMRSPTLRRIFAEHHGVVVGLYSYGCFSPESIPAGTVIGRYCSFAQGVVIFNANHPIERISLHPFFYNPDAGVVEAETIDRGQISIGNDVWMGHGSCVTPRVRTIGNGAIIGAGAMVTHDVPPYAIVAGNPARLIRFRFSEEIRGRIEESRWWERSIEELRPRVSSFLAPAHESLPLLQEARRGAAAAPAAELEQAREDGAGRGSMSASSAPRDTLNDQPASGEDRRYP
ncbi:MAG: CatB-related O-acetyltransferase [Planctomycetes bacterium]|nr:CatB-related O-acetyltransferase [Planctomycetota bacterium]